MALASGVAGLLWAAAWFSGARSMLIITAAGLAGLLLEWLRTRLGMVRAAVAGGLLLVAALVAIVLIAPRAQPGTPLERLFRYLPKTSAADGAYELFWRRDGYGLAAIQAFRESPLNGVGIGTFSTWSPAYFREAGGGYTIAPDNAQNLWRQVLAERGMLGLLPILWLTGLTMAALLRGGPIVLRAVLTGIGVTLLFGFPVQDATIAAAIGLLVAWAAVEGATAPPREESTRAGEAGFVAVLAVSIVAAGIDVAAARGEMRLPARAARFGLPYSQGFGEQEKAPGDVTARLERGDADLQHLHPGRRHLCADHPCAAGRPLGVARLSHLARQRAGRRDVRGRYRAMNTSSGGSRSATNHGWWASSSAREWTLLATASTRVPMAFAHSMSWGVSPITSTCSGVSAGRSPMARAHARRAMLARGSTRSEKAPQGK
jgi:hypothetical protein